MKRIYAIITCIALTGCITNYQATTFYVKNNTSKTVNFKASVEKLSSMGTYIMTVPFTVLPADSVLARQVGIRKGAPPTAWFTDFIIFPVDSVQLNDPKDSANWIPSTNAKGKPVYTFNIAK
jgi:hypothetical protein